MRETNKLALKEDIVAAELEKRNQNEDSSNVYLSSDLKIHIEAIKRNRHNDYQHFYAVFNGMNRTDNSDFSDEDSSGDEDSEQDVGYGSDVEDDNSESMDIDDEMITSFNEERELNRNILLKLMSITLLMKRLLHLLLKEIDEGFTNGAEEELLKKKIVKYSDCHRLESIVHNICLDVMSGTYVDPKTMEYCSVLIKECCENRS